MANINHVGKDGVVYHSWDEYKKANARWEQQERQNKLLEEQNNLLRKQNNISYPNMPLTENAEKAFDSIGLGESMSSMNPIISKFNDIKFALFLHTFGIIIIFFIANAGIIDSFLYYCLRIGTGNTDNKIGLGIFAVYSIYYIFLFIKKLKYKKLSIKEIKKEEKKERKELEELEREANTKMEKEYEPENKITNMIDINKFCTLYNENLQKYYKFFGKDLENEQLESTEINSYRVNKDEFYVSGDEKELNLKFYTAIKNDIKISLLCNENQIVVTASISNTNDIDYISNELIKRIYLPFLSTITAKNIEDSINTWRLITDTDDWKITEDEFSYSLMDDYLFMITNLIFLNFMDRREG
ncbi:MAG TPA: hypothetical protein OIM45_06200 [Clostridiaceae bacterium]|nr:hypothetical protein [Clostridiaceae bacterium]